MTINTPQGRTNSDELPLSSAAGRTIGEKVQLLSRVLYMYVDVFRKTLQLS